MPHQLGVPLAVGLAGGVALRAWLENFRRGLAVARLEHPLEVLGRGRDIADRHRLALDLISLERFAPPQPRITASSFQPRSTASCMPVFMPSAPVGDVRCTESPARKTRSVP